MGAYSNSGYSSNNNIFLIAGAHEQSEGVALNGVKTTKAFGNVDDDQSRVSGLLSEVGLTTGILSNSYNEDSFGSQFPTFSFSVHECSTNTRIVWIPCCSQSEWVRSKQAHYYLYIDNVRVQIAN
jgi:hypothetical protein